MCTWKILNNKKKRNTPRTRLSRRTKNDVIQKNKNFNMFLCVATADITKRTFIQISLTVFTTFHFRKTVHTCTYVRVCVYRSTLWNVSCRTFYAAFIYLIVFILFLYRFVHCLFFFFPTNTFSPTTTDWDTLSAWYI